MTTVSQSMIVSQLSDIHLRVDGVPLKDVIDSEAALKAAVAHVNRMTPPPDIVLVTGDLVQRDSPEAVRRRSYAALVDRLDRLPCRWVAIPGNHDDRDAMREALAPGGHVPAHEGFLQHDLDAHPLRLIGLDSKADDGNQGHLCAERLGWLEARLAARPDHPTLIFLHHPPFATGVGYLDQHYHRFKGASDLAAIIGRHRQVRGLICGHVHRAAQCCLAGVLASAAPAVPFQMSLDFSPAAPSSLVREPSAVPLFRWSDDGGLIAHSSPVGDFGPRYPNDAAARRIMLTLGA